MKKYKSKFEEGLSKEHKMVIDYILSLNHLDTKELIDLFEEVNISRKQYNDMFIKIEYDNGFDEA